MSQIIVYLKYLSIALTGIALDSHDSQWITNCLKGQGGGGVRTPDE